MVRLPPPHSTRCPPLSLLSLEKAIAERLQSFSRELVVLCRSANVDLNDEELWSSLADAAGSILLARLTLEQRRKDERT